MADFGNTSVDRAKALQAAASAEATAATLGPAENLPPPEAPKFSSEEQYTPAYDNHLEELAPLDADVIAHVTEFYFYRKVMVDCLRAIPSAAPRAATHIMVQMIYMQFLMYESARLAIDDLIEFEPRKSESLVSILCSELVVYGYLYRQFGEDYRAQRLHLRRGNYRDVIIDLLDDICRGGKHTLWLKARTTGAELLQRYQAMCEQTGMDPALPPGLTDAFTRESIAGPRPEPAQAA